jgi:class 3 adenylate cyclase/tetratricopeptide (TPR) repeat protein
MVEIRKSSEITADSELSVLLDQHSNLIIELSPQNATAVWKRDSEDGDGRTVRLNLSDAYGSSSLVLHVDDLLDDSRMLARISQLVGDLIYQGHEGLDQPGILSHLASFSPGRLCLRFTECDPYIALPTSEAVPGTLLFADISGFTQLTERLSAKGPVGAEELTLALNSYFGELIQIVDSYGGDVLKFAGDALVAIFEDRMSGSDLRDAASRAAAASLVIQRKMQHFPEVEGTQLLLKIVLVAGTLRIMHLGGVFGRCEILIVGEPLKEVGAADKVAGPSEIIASAGFFGCLDGLVDAIPVEGGHHRIQAFQQGAEKRLECSHRNGQQQLIDAPFRADAVAAMRGYIPAAIYARLVAGQTDWLGELRKVSVLFANLPSFDQETPLEDAQQLMVALQRTVYQFEGSLNKMSVDDKGVSMLVGFGLPPLAHEDDAARAIGCAQALHAKVTELGWSCSIGVATGRIFCGAYGNEQRREYTMIGDTVNTSARLMQAARGQSLCEQVTWRESKSRFTFETLEPVRMKGKSELVPIFRPLARRIHNAHQATERINVIGRTSELQIFDQQLTNLIKHRRGSVVYIEGEAGIGKSHLGNYFEQTAEVAGCRVLYGGGDTIERSTPWFGWRSVITSVIGVDDQRLDSEWLEGRLRERFELSPETLRLIPLLSSVLPVVWPDNDWTAQMSGAIRATNVDELLTELISQAAKQEPLVIYLEDVHWFDSASLEMIHRLALCDDPIIIVAATRPLTKLVPREVESLLKMPVTHHMVLDALSSEETIKVARHLLNARSLPTSVEQLLSERSQGNPLFVEELTFTLRDSGMLEVVSGTGRLTGDLHEFIDQHAADSLAGIVVNRIDSLTPSEQLVIKVASAIGCDFSFALLRDIFPVKSEQADIRGCLKSLCEKQILQISGDHTDKEYAYRNHTLRDVAYNLVLKKHRVELHTAVGEWIEVNYSQELDAHFPRLAEHWIQAGDMKRAVRFLALAGEVALQHNANREAARFFRKAIQLEAEIGEQVDPLERACWQRRYGESLYRQGEIALSLKHLREALKLLGHPAQESLISLSINTGIELFRQLLHRLRSRVFGKPADRPSDTLIEAVRAYERLFEIHYMRNELLGNMLAGFRSLNLAEQYGLCPELARSYASVSVIISSMMMFRSAEQYVARGKRIAEKSSDRASVAYVKAIGSIHFIATGDWVTAREILGEAIPLCSEIGDRRRWSEATALQVNVVVWTGDWDAALDDAEKLRHAAEEDNVPQLIFWGIGWTMWVLSARDPQGEMSRQFENDLEGWVHSKEEIPLADKVFARGGLLLPRLRRGEWGSAVAIANEMETMLGNPRPVAIYQLSTYCAMADLYYALAAAGYESELINQREIRKRLRLLHIRIMVFCMSCPIGKPLCYLSTGRRLILKGRTGRARKILEKGVSSGESLRIPYFVAMLKVELAGIAEDEVSRDALQGQASEIFQQLGIYHPEILSLRPARQADR